MALAYNMFYPQNQAGIRKHFYTCKKKTIHGRSNTIIKQSVTYKFKNP